jgi:DMSO/TMAO reductase YedYZ molybdopterin-dependent catalytic subunit
LRNDMTGQNQIGRRSFLTILTGVGVAGANPATLRNVFALAQQPPITAPNSPFSRAFNFAELRDWITSNNNFFVRSHFGSPDIDLSRWSLSVACDDGPPVLLSIEALMKLPSVDRVVTLECAGNLVGWGGVSNARWTGVPLRSILDPRKIGDALECVLIGADGGVDREAGGVHIDAYARSIPMSKALHPDTLLAYRMNGEPLPAEHGGPLRAIVPGYYGMDSVKWLKKIEVVRHPFTGFYQESRYYEAQRANGATERQPLGAVRLKSQIARPIRGEVLARGPITVVGAAWCGDAEIAAVELSFDSGHAWKPATLAKQRAPYAWRLWSFEWTPDRSGQYEIMARARDERGRLQPLERDPRIVTPYANNWVDRRTVEIR